MPTWVVVLGECRILSRLFRLSSTRNQDLPRWWSSWWAMLNRVLRACTFLGVRMKCSSTVPALLEEVRLFNSALPASQNPPCSMGLCTGI